MAEAYARLVLNGRKTIEQVPARILSEVLDILYAAGWRPPTSTNE